MNFIISKEFESLKKELLTGLDNFNNYPAIFGTGNRNSVKKIDIASRTLIIKSFKVPNLLNQLVYKYFRKSKAARSYQYAQKLGSLGIKSPTPIAYIEEFSLWGLKKSYYISKYLAYDFTYRDLIEFPEKDKNHSILKAFTRFTFKLHEKGVNFLDHSPGNTLIIKTNSGFDFYLVDLNRMYFRPLSFDERMQNFARLSPKKEMVKIMSYEYASLIKKDPEEVYKKMWNYTKQFFDKAHRKRLLKRRFLNRS